jgi:hypothetical protein
LICDFVELQLHYCRGLPEVTDELLQQHSSLLFEIIQFDKIRITTENQTAIHEMIVNEVLCESTSSVHGERTVGFVAPMVKTRFINQLFADCGSFQIPKGPVIIDTVLDFILKILPQYSRCNLLSSETNPGFLQLEFYSLAVQILVLCPRIHRILSTSMFTGQPKFGELESFKITVG